MKENARNGTIKSGFYRRLPDPEDDGTMTLQNHHNYLSQHHSLTSSATLP
jgi:hypothetical protein